MSAQLTRRNFLTGAALAAPAVIVAYDGFTGALKLKDRFLSSGEWVSRTLHENIGRNALAREYGPEDISPKFRVNGTFQPTTPEWQTHAETGFIQWKLPVSGLVRRPLALSLDEIMSLPSRTQITRHDCVEGWSAIGKWTGTPVSEVLDRAGLQEGARYVVFWCSDVIRGWQYYESIDLIDAFHPQTILAYGMNDKLLPTFHGAPLRLRVERQLGYKSAKFLSGIEVVSDFSTIGEGKGGFWQDANGYEWYAGI
ncbi:MAG: molybdopterin-dependent oxidoreductase [Pseudomonadota bacterium]